jgi:hypothetical protein
MMIKLKSKILVLTFAVFSLADVAYEKLGRSDDYGLTEKIVPAVALKNRRLSLISASPLFVGQETVGVMVVYEDTTTKTTSDYVEFYDGAGNLIAVIWFDQFGIERMGIDRGLLEGAAKLEGVFVVFLDGETV